MNVLFLLFLVLPGTKSKPTAKNTYDFIVIGSGAGGGVVASRLAQANKTVALLEAGPDDINYSCTNCGIFDSLPNWPKGAAVLLNFSAQVGMDNNLKWPEWTQEAFARPRPWGRLPQTSPFVKAGTPSSNSSQYLRGRLLGGCTTHNFMMYCRGSRHFYNSLSENYGLDTWDYKHMLPFFRKLETFPKRLQNQFHGSDGPIKVECSSLKGEGIENAYIQAALEAGFPVTNDVYGFQMGATGPACRTIATRNTPGLFNSFKTRSSVPEAYIRPTLQNFGEYLDVQTNSEVIKILFDTKCKKNENKVRSRGSKQSSSSDSKSKQSSSQSTDKPKCKPKAMGVAISRNGNDTLEKIFVRPGGEVIVAGGANLTPKILMASRIGPKEKLARWLKIDKKKIIADIPGIGENMRDHVGVFMSWEFSNKTLSDPVKYLGLPRQDLSSISDVDVWRFPLVVSHISAGKSDTDTVVACGVLSAPLLEWFLDSLIYGTTFPNGAKIPPIMWVCLSSAYRTLSIGHVELNKTDPLRGYPELYMNFFDDEEDIVQVEEGIRFVRAMNGRLIEKGFLKKELWPASRVNDDKSMRDYVLDFSLHIFHTVGTVSMGKGKKYPLNDRCALKDVEGVRVTDTSNYPDVPDCNTYIPAMALGEKCAAHILEDHS